MCDSHTHVWGVCCPLPMLPSPPMSVLKSILNINLSFSPPRFLLCLFICFWKPPLASKSLCGWDWRYVTPCQNLKNVSVETSLLYTGLGSRGGEQTNSVHKTLNALTKDIGREGASGEKGEMEEIQPGWLRCWRVFRSRNCVTLNLLPDRHGQQSHFRMRHRETKVHTPLSPNNTPASVKGQAS